MNYDHLYHAGNHADVLKHLALIALIKALSKKPTPWCYLDTHAGAGVHDLSQLASIFSKEYQQGVHRLIASDDPKPPLVDEYLQLISNANQGEALRFYPGSTLLVNALARDKDRLIACELKSTTRDALKQTFAQNSQVGVHLTDGFLAMKAFLPPKEKRGLVLIDPPYEQQDDWERSVKALNLAAKRWPSGHYLLWYPIKNQSHLMGWLRQLRAAISTDIVLIEMCPNDAISDHMYGSGLALINPIWGFSEQFLPVLRWLHQQLSVKKQGYYRLIPIDSVLK